MKRVIIIILFVVFGFQVVHAQKAETIIKKAQQKVRGHTSYGEMEIQIVRPSWKRTMAMKVWSKGKDYALIRITAPAHDKGTVFLKRQKEVWNWLPSIERTIKLPPSMMQQSWMGTDFTNSDLVKEDSYTDDYTASIIGDSVLQDRGCYKIKLTPKPDAAVVWGKVIVFISKKDYLELRFEFYDEDGYLVNVLNESEVKDLGGRELPSRLVMIPVDKKGHKTIMNYQKMVFDQPIEASFFTKQNMQKVR